MVGYAIAGQFKIPDYGVVSWVTQLVVHSDFRNQDIAKTLLFTIWKFTDHFAWGIVSANPYALRALEKATRRRCAPERIMHNKKKLNTIGIDSVSYINENTDIDIDANVSRIFTKFYIDHSEVLNMIKSVTTPDVPWLMGNIDDGWEWFGFTFQDQDQLSLTQTELEKMLEASDAVTKQAYSRMQLCKKQGWMRYSDLEAKLISDYCGLKKGNHVLDFGCGVGRHSLALAKMGLNVIGIDYIKSFIDEAQRVAVRFPSAKFIVGDCRNIKLPTVDCVICLYDVIGSFADNNQNCAILKNIFNHLSPGGKTLLSVMNYATTESRAKFKFKLKDGPDKLLKLKPGNIMETTGNIFNPNYYIVDTDTQIVYRKEQFTQGDELPTELLVRDRRFYREEIEELCRNISFEIIWSRCVKAGQWEQELDPNDSDAKEILVLCKKPE